MVPTGVGEPRHLDVGQLAHLGVRVRWMPDGQQIVFVGGEAGRPSRVFIQSIAGGPPQAFTPEGVAGPLVVSPDSRIRHRSQPEADNCRNTPSREARRPSLLALCAGDEPLAWSPDGESIWVLNRDTRPAKIFRIELRSGRRSLWREVPYPDPAAIESRPASRGHVGRRQQVRLRLSEAPVRALRREGTAMTRASMVSVRS